MAQSLIWSFTVFHLHFLPRRSSPNHGFYTISTFLMLGFISGALTSPLSSMSVNYCSNSRIITVSACLLLSCCYDCSHAHVCVNICFCFSDLWVALLGCMVNLSFILKKSPSGFPKRLHRDTFLPAMCEVFLFSASLSILVIVCLFNYSYFSEYGVIPHCSFNLHFLMTNGV